MDIPSQSSSIRTDARALRPQAEAGKLGSAAHNASLQAQQKANFNSAVVQVSLAASVEAGNEPLSLLYRSVVESLNEVLEGELGENALQNALEQDNSPQATADRIVSMATGFFQAFAEQNGGADEPGVMEKFMQTIREGFERGFAEAQEILQGLDALTEDISAQINQTYDLVLEGFAAFEQAQSEQAS